MSVLSVSSLRLRGINALFRHYPTARRIDSCNLLFDFYCIVADPALWPNERIDATARGGPEGMRLVTLKAVSGPGDDGEPVMTFMLPEED